ncbi:MAG: DNA polymerase III subunit gamma/tau [Acidimicrobiales bacterium]|nr:DNA polymerase III subunit gamma/tau [Acidimicrobiales bacterium]
MAHLSLYRRYRPRKFSELVGQQHVVTALRNAVRDGRVGHAYLFSGPRGTGKTSTARILGKALNCLDLSPEGEPCCACESCLAFQAGTSYDLHELDAASNNGVDAIRDLIAKVALGSPGRTKVYVLDEVHMLTSGAENALLKTLEEPPPHVVFVLATTEPHKVVSTIRSRTQHYEFELLGAEALAEHVRWVITDAGLDVPGDAVDAVVRMGGGSARDTLSALDQVVAAGGVRPGEDVVEALVEAVCERDVGAAMVAVNDAVRAGREPRVVGELLLARLRDAFLASMAAPLEHLPLAAREQAQARAQRLGPAGLTRAIELVGTALVDMRQAPDPRVDLEVALARLTNPRVDTDVSALVARIERLEAGAVPSAPSAPPELEPAPAPIIDAPAAGQHPAPATDPHVGRSAEPSPAVDDPPPAPSAGGPAAGPQPSPGPGGPAAAARRALKEASAGGAKPTLGAARGTARKPPPAPPESAPAESTQEAAAAVGEDDAVLPDAPEPAAGPTSPAVDASPPEQEAAVPAPEPADVDAVAEASPSTGLPTLPELDAAWESAVRDALPRAAKARFAAGRFVAPTGASVAFGLPNAIHRDRCQGLRPDLEAALTAHFGRPVPVELVVDETDNPSGSEQRPESGQPADDDEIDLEELVDAPDVDTGIDALTKAFPGAVLIEQPDA